MIVSKYKNGNGGGGYVLPTATDSRLGGVKIGSGISVDSGGTISAEGGVAQYDLDAMTQAERAEFVAMCENLTELEREELFVYRDKSICRYDHSEGSGDSFKIGFLDYRQDGWSYPLTYFRHFFVKADGTYESLGNGSYPNIITYDTTYSDTAHTLSNSDGFSPLIPVSNLEYTSDAKVAINLRLIIQRSSPAKVVLSSKAWSERTGNFEGRICAEWHYSGNVITAVWNVVEHTATIASWTEVPEGGGQGPTVINLDTMSQSELADLYNTLSGATSANTINEDYVFLKSFSNDSYGRIEGPIRLQYMYIGSDSIILGNITYDRGYNYTNRYGVSLKSDGTLEVSFDFISTGLSGLKKRQIMRDYWYVYYDTTTSGFSYGTDEMLTPMTWGTGTTCSGMWAFDPNNMFFLNTPGEDADGWANWFGLRVITAEGKRYYGYPSYSYVQLTTPVTLTDSDSNTLSFGYKAYFDYGDCVLSLYFRNEDYRFGGINISFR